MVADAAVANADKHAATINVVPTRMIPDPSKALGFF
jgi:hypothetical protein